MSFVLTYDSLMARVISDLERGNDPVVLASMDSWIKFAHERIARDSNTQLFEVYVAGNFQGGQNVMQKPNRWQNTITWNYGTGTGFNIYNIMKLRTYEFCRDFWPDATLHDQPQFYANYGYQNWLISPTPDQAYPFELGYLETPQVIDVNFQVNYLTEFMPEILLKAVLWEAMITLKNDERIPVIKEGYVELIASWNQKDKFSKTDRYTTGEVD
jgi:hypothetical protein